MPSLKSTVDTLDAVPEAARGFYEPKDGKYVLALDGAPAGFVTAAELAAANGKVVEFRDNNIRLTNENNELKPLKDQFAGIDPKAAKDAIAKVAELGGKGVKGADDLNTLVQAALKPVQDQLAAQAAATVAANQRADEQLLQNKVLEKFAKAGGKAKASDYIVEQAKKSFKVENGEVVALPNLFSTNKPGERLGIDEWLIGAAKDHDFAFEPSTGAGANPLKGGSGGGRPGQTILRNPTPAQLGEASADIAKGKVRVEYTT